MLYYYNEKEIDKFYKEDVVFFCNGAGDICIDGKDKKEEDLPEDLRRAYQELWSENIGSYCYLCQFKGKDSITLCNEFSYDADSEWGKMSKKEFESNVFRNARKIADLLGTQADVVVTKEKTPFADLEVYVVMGADVSVEYFNRVANTLYEFIYEVADVPFHLVERKKDLVSMICELEKGETLELSVGDSDYKTSYCVEKMEWKDSCLVLMGGYGGETKSCFLPVASVTTDKSYNETDHEAVKRLVREFCDLVHVKADDFTIEKAAE